MAGGHGSDDIAGSRDVNAGDPDDRVELIVGAPEFRAGQRDELAVLRDRVRWLQLIVILAVIASVLNAGAAGLGFADHRARLDADRQLLDKVNEVALGASRAAHHAIVLSELRNEQVCSRSNQGAACRELVDRVIGSASGDQLRTLGCLVLDRMAQLPEVRVLRAKSGCGRR